MAGDTWERAEERTWKRAGHVGDSPSQSEPREPGACKRTGTQLVLLRLQTWLFWSRWPTSKVSEIAGARPSRRTFPRSLVSFVLYSLQMDKILQGGWDSQGAFHKVSDAMTPVYTFKSSCGNQAILIPVGTLWISLILSRRIVRHLKVCVDRQEICWYHLKVHDSLHLQYYSDHSKRGTGRQIGNELSYKEGQVTKLRRAGVSAGFSKQQQGQDLIEVLGSKKEVTVGVNSWKKSSTEFALHNFSYLWNIWSVTLIYIAVTHITFGTLFRSQLCNHLLWQQNPRWHAARSHQG